MFFFFFQAEDGIRDKLVTGVQTCALPIYSSGGGGKIGAGDVQWMTAGNGIVHEEFQSQDFTRKGGTQQMVQLRVNLRAKDKSAKPGYQTLLKAQIPVVSLPEDAGTLRVIAGEFAGHKGPAKTFTSIN